MIFVLGLGFGWHRRWHRTGGRFMAAVSSLQKSLPMGGSVGCLLGSVAGIFLTDHEESLGEVQDPRPSSPSQDLAVWPWEERLRGIGSGQAVGVVQSNGGVASRSEG